MSIVFDSNSRDTTRLKLQHMLNKLKCCDSDFDAKDYVIYAGTAVFIDILCIEGCYSPGGRNDPRMAVLWGMEVVIQPFSEDYVCIIKRPVGDN